MAVFEDKAGQGIAVIRVLEIDYHLAPAVDEADVAVALNGCETFGEDPGAAVLGRDGYLARVHIVISALVLRTKDGKGIVAGRGRPVKLDVLDGGLAGGCVPDGDFAIVGTYGDEVVVEEEAVVGDILGDAAVSVEGAGGDGSGDQGRKDPPGGNRTDDGRCFHIACF